MGERKPPFVPEYIPGYIKWLASALAPISSIWSLKPPPSVCSYRYEARETMLWIVGIVGFLLLLDALRRLEVFNLSSLS